MTPNKAIEYIDSIKPNCYAEADKYRWINELEGLVAREVMGLDGSGLNMPEDADKELSVPAPYDEIYPLWLAAKVDFFNREYSNYNNSAMMFSDRMDAYKSWYIRTHTPPARNFKHVMG